MAIDTSSVTALVDEFRTLSAKDSISPETLGALVQRIVDLIATANSDDDMSQLNTLLNNVKKCTSVITAVKVGNGDADNVLVNYHFANLASGISSSMENAILVPAATVARAGAMTAGHVKSLNKALTDIASISSPKTYKPLEVRIVNGTPQLLNHEEYEADGLVLLLFRFTQKRNKNNFNEDDKYGPNLKGWNQMGRKNVVRIKNGTDKLEFADIEHCQMHAIMSDTTYAQRAILLVEPHNDNVSWGKQKVSLWTQDSKRKRMLRFRFAVGYAKDFNDAAKTTNVCQLVSNLAEFSVIHHPMYDGNHNEWYSQWAFGR